MAYYVNTSPTLEGMPQDIIGFAINTLGWVEISPGIIAAPGADAGVGFRVTSLTNGTTARYQRILRVEITNGGTSEPSRTADTYVPYISNGYVSPTRLHLFGGVSGAPYIGIAIEFTPGLYRHLYLGYMEKLGSYGGGEIVSGSHWTKYSSGSFDYTAWEHRYPFSGMSGRWPYSYHQGALRAVHDDAGGEVYFPNYVQSRRDTSNNLVINGILGGFRDNALETALGAGRSPLAGSKLLTPINMFRVLPANRFQPLGRPAGVRMIDIADIDPAAPISVGGKTWRCFPVFKKGGTGAVPGFSDESSYDIGIAYLED